MNDALGLLTFEQKMVHYRNIFAFFVFGMINNFAYVVMYTGAKKILNGRAAVGVLMVFNVYVAYKLAKFQT